MSSLAPRVVLVTRPSDYDRLLARHGTRGQAAFFLERRGQSLAVLERQNEQLAAAVSLAKQAVPDEWSLAQVPREDLDRFLFTERDIVVAVGQDGLVANLAKYLDGQPVIGVTPAPGESEGILTDTPVDRLARLLPRVAHGDTDLQRRTMVEARLDDGQSLTALNELFIGHRSHQSARYFLRFGQEEEFQSSSGVIVSTGTGLTGWARSILTATGRSAAFAPEDRRAVYFTREPWPSHATGANLVFGEVDGEAEVSVTSRMNDSGTIFADGIEQDFLRFDWGITASVALCDRTLNLVVTR
jgi:NAD kinase